MSKASTEAIDRLFLELSQFTNAETEKERQLLYHIASLYEWIYSGTRSVTDERMIKISELLNKSGIPAQKWPTGRQWR